MENIIVYNASLKAKQEISELFEDRGYELLFANTPSDLISLLDTKPLSKVYLHARNLSDIRLLHNLNSLDSNVDVILVVTPQLNDIIELLRNTKFTLMNDIIDVSHKSTREILHVL